MVNGWMQIAHSCVLPPSCILCGDRGQRLTLDICAPCADDLMPNAYPCPVCAHPYAARDDGAWPCGHCLRQPRAFDRAVVPYLYDYPLDRLIHAFKYGATLSYGRVLGTLLAHHIRSRNEALPEALPEALIPVPLHHTRHRERGFNQAYELSRPLSSLLGIPIDEKLCISRRPTVDQTELDVAERRKNVRKAFKLTYTPKYEHVALVDDVLTSCSTGNELARLLKHAGVKRVEIWAIARAGQRAKNHGVNK